MALYNKIKSARPNVTDEDFIDNIVLQNDSDGNGDYIKEWNHPSETQPTEEELA